MKDELDKQLCEKYPKIFRDRNASEIESCMHWGLDCGDGWYDIIDTMCEAATYSYTTSLEIDTEDGLRLNIKPCVWDEITAYYYVIKAPQMIADQVKEKFGTLRFYYHLEYDETVVELLKTKKYPKLERIMDKYNSYFDGIVSFAEILSAHTCEITGNKGELHVSKSGWYKTLNKTLAACDVVHASRGYVPISSLKKKENL